MSSTVTAARARRRPGARHPQRHPRHRRRSPASPRPSSSPSSSRPSTPPGSPRCATTWCAGCIAGGARRRTSTATLDSGDRLPGNAHLGFPGCEGDSLLMLLDARGIECSTGSACSAGVPQASHVLLAMGRDDEAAPHSLRFSLGHTSHRRPTSTRVVEAIGPVRRARPRGRGDESADEGPRRHVGRRRLRRRRRPRRRGRPRRHRHPPGPVAQPGVLPLRRPRLLHDRGQPTTPAARPT